MISFQYQMFRHLEVLSQSMPTVLYCTVLYCSDINSTQNIIKCPRPQLQLHCPFPHGAFFHIQEHPLAKRVLPKYAQESRVEMSIFTVLEPVFSLFFRHFFYSGDIPSSFYRIFMPLVAMAFSPRSGQTPELGWERSRRNTQKRKERVVWNGICVRKVPTEKCRFDFPVWLAIPTRFKRR